MKRLLFIGGTRPNFIKLAALTRAAKKYADTIEIRLIHTGQHYDDEMSQVFFDEFNMPKAHANLDIGSGDRNYHTSAILEKLTPMIADYNPDLVVVVGDVTSTVASAMCAVKLGIPVAHVEAGLRSKNLRMPEEINRIMCDNLSSLLFVSEESAINNLEKEGIEKNRIYFVGNVMIDTLSRFEEIAEQSRVLKDNNLSEYSYALLTMHRPENVDNYERFLELFGALCEIQGFIDVVCPLHPRTKTMSERFGINWNSKYSPRALPPQSYFGFLKLQRYAKFIITDSGGIQEEASVFGIPTITIREETERPITITHGTNKVVGVKREQIVESAKLASSGNWKRRRAIIPYWDGNSADRIIKIIVRELEKGIYLPKNISHYKSL